MIKIEKTQVVGLEPTIRGMRNPMNSWGKSDSDWCTKQFDEICETCESHGNHCVDGFLVGAADEDLMLRLAKAGSVDEKFRRMIAVYVDLTAPLYWWKEFDAYKVGTVANSCSTMHKIHAKEFTLDDFSCEHLFNEPYHRDLITSAMVDEDITSRSKVWATPLDILKFTIEMLNAWREQYLSTQNKEDWWQMIQLLPSSYNQKRTVMLNYEVLANIYQHRRNHKLDEWKELCKWIEGLPYSEIITLKKKK